MKSPLNSTALARLISLLVAIAMWYVIRQHLAQPVTPTPLPENPPAKHAP